MTVTSTWTVKGWMEKFSQGMKEKARRSKDLQLLEDGF